MRPRLLRSTLAVTTIALILLGVPLAVAISHLYRSQELTRVQQDATLAAGAVPDTGLMSNDPVEPPVIPGRPTTFAYYSLSGTRVAGSGSPSADRTTRAALNGRVHRGIDHGHLVVAMPITAGETTTGVVRASAPIGPLEARIRTAWLAIVALGGFALAVAAVLGRRQARNLATPVTALAAAMERLGQGDFTVRAPTATGTAELDAAGHALAATATNLDDLLGRQRAFSADVSHQLRTPLAALRVTLEMALIAGDRNANEVLVDATAELDRLEETVRALLDHAQSSTAVQERLDLAAITASAERRWHAPLAEAGRPLAVTVDPIPEVVGSPTVVSQIVDVLLDNALRHGQGPVTLHVRAVGPGVALDVADEGDGINQDPESIFKRGVSHNNGHGIGLALARALAESHRGKLLVHRARPHPVFSLLLPAGTRAPTLTDPYPLCAVAQTNRSAVNGHGS